MRIKKDINKKIFRDYDIRGVYGVDIDEDVAYTIGRSFGSYVKNIGEKQTVVGYDNRLSSKGLNDALIKGINESGINVISLGLVTTPMYYCSKYLYEIKTGMMITASHNPKEYNGFKVSFSHMGPAYGKLIYDFMDFVYEYNYSQGEGTITHKDVKNDYLNVIKTGIKLGRTKLRVVADSGNGTGSIILKEVLDMFNFEYKIINGISDGTFPNHHPDPSIKSNMVQLSEKVKELGYDIGIAIDGDADRVGIVDENGNVIPIDILILIVYRSINKDMRNRKALFDVKCSKALIDGLDDLKLEKVMYRTGASYLSMMMQEGDFDFGGEYSGHLFFRDKFPGFDDGIYSALRIIEILSKTKKKASELVTNINKYYSTEELKYTSPDNIKVKVVERIKEFFKQNNYEITDIDGVRVNINNGWILIRASNTGPNITARCEASSVENLNLLKNLLDNLMLEYNK